VRWRQVIVLWLVALVMAGAYLRLTPEGPAAPSPDDRPPRRRVFGVDPANLAEVRIERGDRRVVIRRDGNGWSVIEPADAAVPRDLLAAFVTTLLEAEEIDRVERGDETPDQFGLGDAATRLELWGVAPGAEVLLVGATNPTGTAVYARRPGAPEIILIGRTVLYYEDLILQALPTPTVPADTQGGPVGRLSPLTRRGRPV
jgi:uncharacterized protein DUF4340